MDTENTDENTQPEETATPDPTEAEAQSAQRRADAHVAEILNGDSPLDEDNPEGNVEQAEASVIPEVEEVEAEENTQQDEVLPAPNENEGQTMTKFLPPSHDGEVGEGEVLSERHPNSPVEEPEFISDDAEPKFDHSNSARTPVPDPGEDGKGNYPSQVDNER